MIALSQITITADFFKNITPLLWVIFAFLMFFSLRKELLSLLKRLTKVEIAGNKIEAIHQDNNQKNLSHEGISNIDKYLAVYANETVSRFEAFVKEESKYEQLANDGQKIEMLKKYSTILYIKNNFDIIYEDIFGSQIRILQHLNGFPTENADSLIRFYEEKLSGSGYSYESYLEYLFRINLITKDGDNIVITILGADFLKFLVLTNKRLDKPY